MAGTVLVLGGNGFIGGYIVAALRESGWSVIKGVRPHGQPPADDECHCDLMRMQAPQDWAPLLEGVDAVVNVAGILREEQGQTFAGLHVDGPLALAEACVAQGVDCFVQVSALGAPEDGDFIASKHDFDQRLLALPLRAVVLRPSLVYAAAGSYGGSSLLRALAGFPGFQWLPGHARWLVQPVAAEDVGRTVVVALVSKRTRGVYEVGGPQRMSLAEYQSAWRRWLRIPGRRALHVPEPLVSMQVALWERLGRGPVGQTMWRMLRRGNVAADNALPRLHDDLGIEPRSLTAALAAQPSQVQDRWQAQLYFLVPTLRLAVVVLWLISAWAGWRTPAAEIEQLTAGSALATLEPVALARIAAGIDLVLALWLASGWRPRLVLGLMGISVLAYTVVFGLLLPGLWLEPLGGLAKNLVLLPALAVLWVLVERR
ncbi:SDR family oxidoreductase [Luteimonas sp. e5]